MLAAGQLRRGVEPQYKLLCVKTRVLLCPIYLNTGTRHKIEKVAIGYKPMMKWERGIHDGLPNAYDMLIRQSDSFL